MNPSSIRISPDILGTADLSLLEALLEDLHDVPYFAKDSDLRYRSANPAMAALCGMRRPADLLGRRAADFFPSSLARRYEALDQEILESGRRLSNRIDLSMRAGTVPTWLVFSRSALRDSEGNIVGVVATGRMVGAHNRGRKVAERVSRAVKHLRRYRNQPLSVAAVAAAAGTSVAQLQRDFVSVFALSPQAFLRRLRIEEALVMLEGARSISYIGHAVGFSDHSAFSRCFRETLGLSPSRYRALYRSQNRAD